MSEHDRLPIEELDPGTTVYVADRALNVVFTNLAWQEFALENNGSSIRGSKPKLNLLEGMSKEQALRWGVIYQQLLEGKMACHRERYLCPSPSEKRVFELQITPHHTDTGEVGWLVHQTVRIDAVPLSEQLEALEHSRDRVREEYHNRILLCDVCPPGYDCSQYQEPLEELGGDLIWSKHYPHGITDVVHADVVGHGEDAACLATKMVAILDVIAAPEKDLGVIVQELNRILLESTDEDICRFATGLYFRLSANEPVLQCVNFGHLQPLFSRSGPVELYRGLPVGMIEEQAPWQVDRIDPQEHGRRFLIYSDGVTEQFNKQGEMFGLDRLWHSFHQHELCPLDEILAVVRQDLETFRGDAIIKDDQTMLVLELQS